MTSLELIQDLRIPDPIRHELLDLLRLPQNEAMAGLERLLEELASHRRIYEVKRRKQRERRILWGRELEESIQRYLNAGKCLRTAKILAGRDFRKAHPQDTDSDAVPGHSGPALRRYLRAYRQNNKP